MHLRELEAINSGSVLAASRSIETSFSYVGLPLHALCYLAV